MSALLTPEQARARLNVGRNTIYSFLRTGRLKSIRFGRAIRVTESELQRFVNEAELRQSALKT